MTLIHTRTKFQRSAETRGAALACAFHLLRSRLTYSIGLDTETEVSRMFAEKADAAAVREVVLAGADTKKEEEAEIEKGLEVLSSRFKSNPSIPDVPGEVIQEGCIQDFDDVEVAQSSYPSLDADVISALMERSDLDLHPSGVTIAVGNHFAIQKWDDDELKGWVERMYNHLQLHGWPSRGELSSKNRAELIADLAEGYISYGNKSTGFHYLKHNASLVRNLSADELKQVVKDEGISIGAHATRSSLVVKIVEHIFADVLEPADAEVSKTGQPDPRRQPSFI